MSSSSSSSASSPSLSTRSKKHQNSSTEFKEESNKKIILDPQAIDSSSFPPSVPPPSYQESIEEGSYITLDRILEEKTGRGYLRLQSASTFGQKKIRTPIDLILVVDISGSMGTVVTGCLESEGFTRLDLVKHSINIIAENLCETDSLTLIPFNDTATIQCPRMQMTPDNVKKLKQEGSQLKPNCSTHLYDAIDTAFKYIKVNPLPQTDEQFINRHIVVLTDGEPTQNPPMGMSYDKLIENHQTSSPICKHTLVHTFGITYNSLDDKLLGQIATKGNGMYGFISDGTIIVPCFINILGVLFNMLVSGLELTIQCTQSTSVNHGKQCILPISWILQEGTVEYGLPQWVLDESATSLTYTLLSNSHRKMRINVQTILNDEPVQQFHLRKEFGTKLISMSDQCGTHSPATRSRIADELKELMTHQPTVDTWSEPGRIWFSHLVSDIDLYKRINPESLRLWDIFCLRSLGMSLIDDYITNGYEQSYKHKPGQTRLGFWLESIENVAKKITPPNPSSTPYKGDGGSMSKSAFSSSTNSSYLYSASSVPFSFSASSYSYPSSDDYSDGCIDGECWVQMADPMHSKQVKDIHIGDRVWTDTGVQTVRCVILVPDRDLIELPNGLRITPMHPIQYEGKWIFPHQHPLGTRVMLKQDIPMYSFLLESSATSTAMKIQETWVVHFAHQNPDPVLTHPFYGTQKIRTCLEQLDPDRLGHIQITRVRRNEQGEVCEYQGHPYTPSL